MEKEYDIVAMGELLIDFTPAGVSETGMCLYERNPGGAPVNMLTAAAKAGLRTAFIGKESCVIVGKCADYVLKNRPNVVSIYIEAPRAFCVERTIANMGVTPEVANATIERTDKFRADYYKYYTHGNYWTNPVNYDLTLNSERVGVENCVKTIEQYLIIKGFIKADMIKPVGELI